MENEVLEYLLKNIAPEKTDIPTPTKTKTSMKIKETNNDKSSNETKLESSSITGEI
ncbi:hypothetical protein DPMN_051631 [Dreissena polymorpha]|uniref:Uncharacterized protein n=1 Tax=Dreissena polymorpha TaxID=45954 RepID=A0A9D4CJQ4_DREPO|nr:hypothetical protein DPMN_051631 [Dreissena polymorpha]